MAASIDTYTFVAWSGDMPQAVRAHREITRPGVDGTGVVWDAWRRPRAIIATTTICADKSEADSLEIAFRNLIGKTVTVTDPIGQVFADTLVLDAPCLKRAHLIDDEWVLTTTWTLLATSAAPTSTTP